MGEIVRNLWHTKRLRPANAFLAGFGLPLAKNAFADSISSPNGDLAVLRIALIAAAVCFLAAPSQADAQMNYGFGNPYGYQYGYSPYGSYYGGYYRAPYQGEYGYYGHRYPQYQRPYNPGYVVPSVPSGTGNAIGSGPNNGNYWYWLQQQANQGKIPQSEVNRRMYGNR